MCYFVIIRGSLGVGKTTVARKLAEALDAEYISVDGILRIHNLDNIAGHQNIPSENFIKGNEIIIPRIREALGKGKIAIIDGCFYHKEQIEGLHTQDKVSYFIFTLKAPLEICIDRDSKRANSYGKEAATAVFSLVSRFDYGVVVETKDKSVAETVYEILSRLPGTDNSHNTY